VLFCKDRINPDCFLIFLVKKHNHALWQSIFLLWLFLPAESNVRMSVFTVVQYIILQLSPYPFCAISSPEFHHKEKSA